VKGGKGPHAPWAGATITRARGKPAGFYFTDADVRVDACVAGGAGEVFVFAVRDVLVAPRVPVLLGEPEVDDVHHVLALAQPNLQAKKDD
jgi:hypothetical protein